MFRRTETTAAAMTSPKQVVSKAIFRVCLSQQLNDANPLFRCHRCPWKDLPDIGLCNQPVFYRSEQLLTDWYRLTLLIQIYPFFFLSHDDDAAEERRPQTRPFLQDVSHLFRRFHSGRESFAPCHVHQMSARRQSAPLRLDARHEPGKRVSPSSSTYLISC